MEQWKRLECAVPSDGKDMALYLIPHGNTTAWTCDLGHLYCKEGVTYWESAFGIYSALDGRSLHALLQKYEIWFADVPPLLHGRVPQGFDKATREA